MPKNVIITGANGGLGTAVVNKFLKSGFHIIATVFSEKHIETMEKNDHLEVHAVDLSNEQAAARFAAAAIEKHGRIDAAIMLVGGFAAGGIEKTTGDDLHKMFSLNFETAYYTTRPLFEHMINNNSGRLVFVGARPAVKASDGKNMLAYALSKSLVIKLAELLNATAKGKNVTASVFIPSTIDTPPNRSSMPEANFEDWVKPEQLADLMEMACTETGAPLRESIFKVYGNS
jgi:NAD(P)-dependent dehydrogenase (short-subunit alcohol dehydrogenase family)